MNTVILFLGRFKKTARLKCFKILHSDFNTFLSILIHFYFKSVLC